MILRLLPKNYLAICVRFITRSWFISYFLGLQSTFLFILVFSPKTTKTKIKNILFYLIYSTYSYKIKPTFFYCFVNSFWWKPHKRLKKCYKKAVDFLLFVFWLFFNLNKSVLNEANASLYSSEKWIGSISLFFLKRTILWAEAKKLEFNNPHNALRFFY